MRRCSSGRCNVLLRNTFSDVKRPRCWRHAHQLALSADITGGADGVYAFPGQVPQPPANKRTDPQAWLSVLTSVPNQTHDDEVLGTVSYRLAQANIPWRCDVHTIMRTIAQARAQSNIDLLHSLAVTHSRWDELLSIVSATAKTNKPLVNMSRPLVNLTDTLRFSANQTLDQFTTAEQNSTHQDSRLRMSDVKSASSNLVLDYDKILRRELSHETDRLAADEHDRVGEVLLSLGNLIVTAALARSNNPSEADVFLFNVVSALSCLSGVAWNLNFIFTERSSHTISDPDRSVWLDSHKQDIKEVFMRLSALRDGDKKSLSINEISNKFERGIISLMRRVGDSIWLEFVLQICFYGGWFRQGALILQGLHRGPGKARLALRVVSPTDSRDKNERRLRTAGKTGFVVNAQSVCAIIDGLVMDLTATMPQLTFASVSRSIYSVKFLKAILDENAMSLGSTSWHTIVTRLADSPWLDIKGRPQLMELILELIPLNSREANSANATAPAYVNDGTAATLPLFHKTLLAYVESGDLKGAYRVLSLVRNLTRDNEFETLSAFKNNLHATSKSAFSQPGTRLTPFNGDVDATVPLCEIPMLRSQIPINSFAALLDLVSARGDIQLGKPLIHWISNEMALSPNQLYSDQDLAPALIRFATVSNNVDLLSEVMSSQPASAVSASTVISICKQRIQQGHWKEVDHILETLKQHESLKWTIYDNVTIGGALLPFLTDASKSESPKDYQVAMRILRNLLRGDMGGTSIGRLNELESLVWLLADVEPNVAITCGDLLRNQNALDLGIPTNAFDVFMNEVAATHGSRKSQALLQKWCSKGLILQSQASHSSDDSSDISTGVIRPSSESIDEGGSLAISTEYRGVTSSARINKPSLSTIRIIIHQALSELDSIEDTADQYPLFQPDNPKDDLEDLIEWSANVLRDDFLMSDVDIDYELGGWLSRQQNVSLSKDVPYSSHTIFYWNLLFENEKYWARRLEELVRSFALNENSVQISTRISSSRIQGFLKRLASDYGLHIVLTGRQQNRLAKILKLGPETPRVPPATIEDYLARSKTYRTR